MLTFQFLLKHYDNCTIRIIKIILNWFSLSSLAYLYLRLHCCLFSIFNFNEERLPSPLALSNVAQEGA